MPTKEDERPLRRKDEDEGTEELPVGHPRAGYVSPDYSKEPGSQTKLPPQEEEWAKNRDEKREEDVERVRKAESEAAKEEREAAAEEAKKLQEAAAKKEAAVTAAAAKKTS